VGPAHRLVAIGLTACGPGEADPDAGPGARLTTTGAGELLSTGFTPSEPESPLAALYRTPPIMPSAAQMSVDSLGVDFGTTEAPLRIIEFYDYGCGYCRLFHQDTRDPLHEAYVDPGRVLWKSMPFITGNWASSMAVSLAAECAREQGRSYFEAISDLIFEHQREWKSASDPGVLSEGFAEEAGLDMVRYRTCFEGEELLWRVQAQTNLAEELGIRATPTFLLVGVGPISGALPLETFQQIIDTVLVQVAVGPL
jgi:protein-disulfide isomerase